jgi:hypothetical protein
VYQLVADHVVGVRERTCKRQHNAPTQSFGHTAGALADLAANDVGLLELDVGAIQDEWLAAAKLVPQQAFEPHPPTLGHAGSDLNTGPLAWIEIDVEVFSLEDLEVQVAILNLVPPEVLR